MGLGGRLITCPTEAAQKGFLILQREGLGGGGDFLLSVRGISGPQGEWSTYFLPSPPSARKEVQRVKVCGTGGGLVGASRERSGACLTDR